MKKTSKAYREISAYSLKEAPGRGAMVAIVFRIERKAVKIRPAKKTFSQKALEES